MTARDPLAAGPSLRLGLLALAIFAIAAFLAAFLVRIDGALVLAGRVEAVAPPVPVQAVEGGVVAEVLVQAGDRVARGATIARLDATTLRAEREEQRRERYETALHQALFAAERDGLSAFPTGCCDPAATQDPDRARTRLDAAGRLFEARRRSYLADLAALSLQLREAEARRTGLIAERATVARRADIAARDRATADRLAASGLALSARLGALDRERAEIEGALTRLDASIGDAELTAEAVRRETGARRADRRRAAEEALAEAERALPLLDARIAELDRRIARLRIVAPVEGVVVDPPPGPGAVLSAGQVVVVLAPAVGRFRIVAPIDPRDIDAARIGQAARLRLTAFAGAGTPEIPARLGRLSALPLRDDRSGRLYYDAMIIPEPEALAAVPPPGLLPAMPVEVFLTLGARRPVDILTRALSDYFTRAFRAG